MIDRSPWCDYSEVHRRPTALCCLIPSISVRLCRESRRHGLIHQLQRLCGSRRGRSLRLKVRWYRCYFLHRQVVRIRHHPSTSRHRCQEWHNVCQSRQQRQQPSGPGRGQSVWMKVRWCACCFHHRQVARFRHGPNTSGHRCRGQRRCYLRKQLQQQPFDQNRDLSPRTAWKCPSRRGAPGSSP